MIEWANANNGFLMVVLTIVYVTATIAMMIFMAVSNRLTRESILQFDRFEKSRLRPYLSIYIKKVLYENNGKKQELASGYLCLENSGITQAKNIKVTMNPKIYHEPIYGGKKTKMYPYFILNDTPSLAPKQKITDSIGFLASIYDIFEKPVFDGLLEYEDVNGNKYEEKFKIDMDVMKDAVPYYE